MPALSSTTSTVPKPAIRLSVSQTRLQHETGGDSQTHRLCMDPGTDSDEDQDGNGDGSSGEEQWGRTNSRVDTACFGTELKH